MTKRERQAVISGIAGLVGKRTPWILVQLANPRPGDGGKIRYDLDITAANVHQQCIQQVFRDCAGVIGNTPGNSMPDAVITPEDN